MRFFAVCLGISGLGHFSPMLVHQRAKSIAFAIACGIFSLFGSGCATVNMSVGNPVPGMTTIAVAPFFNLSTEPTVDGRRFAIAYYSELQKTANYQVIPVGVVEQVIRDNELDMSSPDDAVRLAELLEADAVVVGAVTEYVPYYPPQLALHIQWYSPHDWMHCGIVSESAAIVNPLGSGGDDLEGSPAEGKLITRGQSPAEGEDPSRRQAFVPRSLPEKPRSGVRVAQSRSGGSGSKKSAAEPTLWPPQYAPEDSGRGAGSGPVRDAGRDTGSTGAPLSTQNLQPAPRARTAAPVRSKPPQPIMAYTRFFDGTDQNLLDALKGYYIMRGDQRSGGWEAYLHRSDDFLRFASHLMILEMLSLHGGLLTTDSYVTFWK
jgi:hypothetical protein